MDDAVREHEGISEELSVAISQEDYETASALRNLQQRVERSDCVGNVLSELDQALKEERYDRAALLRDAGGAGLLGWWAGKAERDDAHGHMVHITSDFGRYVANAYTGVNIAEMMGLQEGVSRGNGDFVPTTTSMGQQRNNKGRNNNSNSKNTGSPQSGVAKNNTFYLSDDHNNNDDDEFMRYQQQQLEDEAGVPVFEIFVRPNGDGGFIQQAAALHAPLSALDIGRGELDDLTAMLASQMDGGASVSIERGEGDDGVGFVRINVVGGPSLTNGDDTVSGIKLFGNEADEEDEGYAVSDGNNDADAVLDDIVAMLNSAASDSVQNGVNQKSIKPIVVVDDDVDDELDDESAAAVQGGDSVVEAWMEIDGTLQKVPLQRVIGNAIF